ncbi:MAG TPA: cytochrome c [Terriglobales bacterium]
MMRDFKVCSAIVLIALIVTLIPSPSWAGDDTAKLYQTRCAVCHGADGHAETPMGKKQSIPSFASSKFQKTPNAAIEDCILTGGKEQKPSHAFSGKGITSEDAKKLATYLKELGSRK